MPDGLPGIYHRLHGMVHGTRLQKINLSEYHCFFFFFEIKYRCISCFSRTMNFVKTCIVLLISCPSYLQSAGDEYVGKLSLSFLGQTKSICLSLLNLYLFPLSAKIQSKIKFSFKRISSELKAYEQFYHLSLGMFSFAI